MLEIFAPLRELTVLSVCLRLFIAMVFGGIIGLERGRKGRPAGFRTYMIVCLGAALTMLLGQYDSLMLATQWQISGSHLSADIARFSAQVINGIGFLGAGTIIITGRQAVKGLTTAAGLWASACVGLAIGAGFYECVILGFVLILLCVCLLPAAESFLTAKARNINLYVEFQSLEDMGEIINRVKSCGVQIYEVDIDHGNTQRTRNPSAVFALRMHERQSHSQILAAISELETVLIIDEI